MAATFLDVGCPAAAFLVGRCFTTALLLPDARWADFATLLAFLSAALGLGGFLAVGFALPAVLTARLVAGRSAATLPALRLAFGGLAATLEVVSVALPLC